MHSSHSRGLSRAAALCHRLRPRLLFHFWSVWSDSRDQTSPSHGSACPRSAWKWRSCGCWAEADLTRSSLFKLLKLMRVCRLIKLKWRRGCSLFFPIWRVRIGREAVNVFVTDCWMYNVSDGPYRYRGKCKPVCVCVCVCVCPRLSNLNNLLLVSEVQQSLPFRAFQPSLERKSGPRPQTDSLYRN